MCTDKEKEEEVERCIIEKEGEKGAREDFLDAAMLNYFALPYGGMADRERAYVDDRAGNGEREVGNEEWY